MSIMVFNDDVFCSTVSVVFEDFYGGACTSVCACVRVVRLSFLVQK